MAGGKTKGAGGGGGGGKSGGKGTGKGKAPASGGSSSSGGKGKGKAKEASSEDGGKMRGVAKVHCRHILCEKQSKCLEAHQRVTGEFEQDGRKLPAQDFAEVARAMSEDKARSGGDLGWFIRGAMAKTFEDVAFNLPVGAISEPFKTEHGWHIVKCEGRQ